MRALTESSLRAEDATFQATVRAGDGFLREIKAGQTVRLLDLEGNQAADTLFYSARNPVERYSASDTIQRQANVYLTTGSQLISTEGNLMLTITADTCGRHDTLGGACASESNMVRYALDKKFMHNCRDTFLREICEHNVQDPRTGGIFPMGKRDVTSNINFFMNVPVTPDGRLTFEDGISEAGKYVELRAEMDVLIVISNCPQLNNPCNAYNPTPIAVLIWD